MALLPVCFGIEGDDTVVVIDPYTPEVAGLDPMHEPADVVVMSSATDKFHSDGAMAPVYYQSSIWPPCPRRGSRPAIRTPR